MEFLDKYYLEEMCHVHKCRPASFPEILDKRKLINVWLSFDNEAITTTQTDEIT